MLGRRLLSKCNSPSRLWCNMWASMATCDGNISIDSCSFTNNNNININDHYTTIGLTTMMATAMEQQQQQQQQWQLGLETHLCLKPQVYFSFLINVLTYAQEIAGHNTGYQLQVHMQRLRRIASWASQVSFLYFLLYKWLITNRLHVQNGNGNHNDRRGSQGATTTGTTATTKAEPRQDQDGNGNKSGSQSALGMMGMDRTNEETSNKAGRFHLLVPLVSFFSSLNFKNTNDVSTSRTTVWPIPRSTPTTTTWTMLGRRRWQHSNDHHNTTWARGGDRTSKKPKHDMTAGW